MLNRFSLPVVVVILGKCIQKNRLHDSILKFCSSDVKELT
jgi:hypothetical protein